MNKIQKIISYLLLFVLALFLNYLFYIDFYDGLVQYGMAHAIRIGEIPYLDFNTVVAPIYIYFISLFLFIYDDFLTFLIINSILYTLLYYFANKILTKHKFTFFLITSLPLFHLLSPSYNLFAKVLLLLIIYFEVHKRSDYQIGILLGLLILTKHSVGLCVLLCSFLCSFKKESILKRSLGVGVVLLIFLLYLVLTHSFTAFFDLCILGLFNFQKNNTIFSPYLFIFSIFILIFSIWYIIKHKNNDQSKIFYYVIGSLSFLIPIIDFNHFTGVLFFFFLGVLSSCEFPLQERFFQVFLIGILIFTFTHLFSFQNITLKKYPHFILYLETYPDQEKILDAYKKYPNSVMIDPWSMKFDLMADKKITYFDVPLTGNYGYHGTSNMIKRLKKKTYYFIPTDYQHPGVSQFDQELCEYVINHSKLVETVSYFSIYYYS